MKLFKIFILTIIFPTVVGAAIHKFYASTTKIEYVPQEQSVQIITEIFTDDIQQALSKRNLREIHLDSKKQTPADVLLLRDYVFKKLVVYFHGYEVDVFTIKNKSAFRKTRNLHCIFYNCVCFV